MSKVDNKRRHERLNIRSNVFITGENFDRFKTQTMDFSDGGLFVEGKVLALLPIDTLITVQIAEDFEEPPLVPARIAWTNSYGAGIEYISDK